MSTVSTIAIHADRSRALQAFAAATRTRETHPPEPFDDADDAADALMERLESGGDGYPLLVSSVADWTLLEEPQLVVPSDAELLAAISSELQTQVVALVVQTNSNAFGLVCCDRGKVTRRYLAIDGEIEHDDGELPVIPEDDETGETWAVQAAFDTLVPVIQETTLELRTFTAAESAH